jgi:predicted nicotinamide N-methyase
MTAAPPADPAAFIRSRLHLVAVPDCPAIRLYAPDARSGLGRLAGTPPYWAYAWAGGLALARHLAEHPELVSGRRVLDFGAGTGLLAIAAAQAGAGAVMAADIDPAARAAIALNAAANGAAVAILDADLTAPGAALPEIDIVLAGDVFYLPRIARRVLPVLERCAAAGKTVLVGDPFRAPLPRALLQPIAEYQVTDMGQGGGRKTAAGVFSLPPGALNH